MEKTAKRNDPGMKAVKEILLDSKRLKVSTPELDQKEFLWWQKYSELEERFCWVQPREVQLSLRGNYLKEIVKCVPAEGSVLELGCGTGWLSLLLAELGAHRVVGVDFSEAQIAKAQEHVLRLGLQDRVRFQRQTLEELSGTEERFDVIVIHAFLHHLSVAEIENLVCEIRRIVKPFGKIIIFEPVQYSPRLDEGIRSKLLRKTIEKIISILISPRVLQFGKRSLEEKKYRKMMGERHEGIPPFGVSPKEIPFQENELEALLDPYFRVISKKPYMSFSTVFVQEMLLTELSYPRLAKFLRKFFLEGIKWIERQQCALDKQPPGLWVFEMFICELAEAAAPKEAEEGRRLF